MAEPKTRTFVEQATEWLNGPLSNSPNRWEFLWLLAMLAGFVWWLAHTWGWNEGMAEAVRLHSQARRDELESWQERARSNLRDDIAQGVARALNQQPRRGSDG